jgi:hypothetical protein
LSRQEKKGSEKSGPENIHKSLVLGLSKRLSGGKHCKSSSSMPLSGISISLIFSGCSNRVWQVSSLSNPSCARHVETSAVERKFAS